MISILETLASMMFAENPGGIMPIMSEYRRKEKGQIASFIEEWSGPTKFVLIIATILGVIWWQLGWKWLVGTVATAAVILGIILFIIWLYWPKAEKAPEEIEEND